MALLRNFLLCFSVFSCLHLCLAEPLDFLKAAEDLKAGLEVLKSASAEYIAESNSKLSPRDPQFGRPGFGRPGGFGGRPPWAGGGSGGGGGFFPPPVPPPTTTTTAVPNPTPTSTPDDFAEQLAELIDQLGDSLEALILFLKANFPFFPLPTLIPSTSSTTSSLSLSSSSSTGFSNTTTTTESSAITSVTSTIFTNATTTTTFETSTFTSTPTTISTSTSDLSASLSPSTTSLTSTETFGSSSTSDGSPSSATGTTTDLTTTPSTSETSETSVSTSTDSTSSTLNNESTSTTSTDATTTVFATTMTSSDTSSTSSTDSTATTTNSEVTTTTSFENDPPTTSITTTSSNDDSTTVTTETTSTTSADVTTTFSTSTTSTSTNDEGTSTSSSETTFTSSTIATSLSSTSTSTTAIQETTTSTTTEAETTTTSTTTTTTTTSSAAPTFNPQARNLNAAYYGQTPLTQTVSLTQVCADNDIDMVILSFITSFYNNAYPNLNMGSHCWAATAAQLAAGGPGLLDCVGDGFAAEVAACQSRGKKVLLSMGGAAEFSDLSIPSEDAAVDLADTLWNLLLGGDDEEVAPLRPFGDVVFDGLDFDNEDPSDSANLAILASSLRSIFANDPRPFYLSAAPQCPYPDISIPVTEFISNIDFWFVQFYNNPACQINAGAGFLSSLQTWSSAIISTTGAPENRTIRARSPQQQGSLHHPRHKPATSRRDNYHSHSVRSSSTHAFMHDSRTSSINKRQSGSFTTLPANGIASPLLFIGTPAFQWSPSNGFVTPQQYKAILQDVKELNLPNLAGAMFWDAAHLVTGADDVDGESKTLAAVVKGVFALEEEQEEADGEDGGDGGESGEGGEGDGDVVLTIGLERADGAGPGRGFQGQSPRGGEDGNESESDGEDVDATKARRQSIKMKRKTRTRTRRSS